MFYIMAPLEQSQTRSYLRQVCQVAAPGRSLIFTIALFANSAVADCQTGA